MRWLSDPLKNKVGDTRVIRKFLFFPCTLENETRWLESSYIFQKVIDFKEYGERNKWCSIKFVSRRNPDYIEIDGE